MKYEKERDISEGQQDRKTVKALMPKISTGVICSIGLLVALQIVLERYLSISVLGYLRFKFTFVAQAVAGVCLGPVYGMIAAVVADLLGCLFTGQVPIPLLTVVAGLRGIAFGFFLFRKQNILRITAATVFDQLICGILISSYALAPFYGMDYGVMIIERIPQCLILFAIEIVLLYVFHRSKFFRELKKLSSR